MLSAAPPANVHHPATRRPQRTRCWQLLVGVEPEVVDITSSADRSACGVCPLPLARVIGVALKLSHVVVCASTACCRAAFLGAIIARARRAGSMPR
jgi:hypothetical protein